MLRRAQRGIGISHAYKGNRNACTFSDLHEVIARRKDGPSPTLVPKELPDFSNTKNAYKHMSTLELVRSLVVLKMCRIAPIRDNGPKLLSSASKVFGEYLTYNTAVRWTMYKHFCAGENDREVKCAMGRLAKVGVGSILDYAAEADVEPTSGSYSKIPPGLDVHLNDKSIPYPARDEQLYDANMKLYAMSVTQAALNNSDGWATCALKVTAFCDPILLSRSSAVDLGIRRLWAVIQGHDSKLPLEEYRVVVNVNNSSERYVSRSQLKKFIKDSIVDMSEQDTEKFLNKLDPSGSGQVDYFQFTRVLSDALLPSEEEPSEVSSEINRFASVLPQLTDIERKLWCVMVGRVNTVLSLAKDLKVRVMIDAEHSFYQSAIDHVVRIMQRKYNCTSPIIYGTFQCYITFTRSRLENDMERARLEGWHWAGKIVRGAYMVQEREHASTHKYKCPIFQNIDETHASYNGAAEYILKQMVEQPNKPFAVLFGTHNQQSLEVITKLISTMGPNKGEVAFAELYGMADYLTMPMALAGYKIYKYVPYGPVKETIQYLARRAIENGSILSGSLDVPKMEAELKDRLFPKLKSS